MLRKIVEGLLLASDKPLSLPRIAEVFPEQARPDEVLLKSVLAAISDSCAGKGFELKEVSSGFRFQVRQELSSWISRLWEEKPQRYTRALLETLALIAYRQPITRGDIEEIRGVGVSSTIIRTLLDREWIRVVGHRDVPGRPAMFATTRQFLDYFNLKSLQELPPLSEIRDLDQLNQELVFDDAREEMRVLDLPDEQQIQEQGSNQTDENGNSVAAEHSLSEEEALALARRPLDEILGLHQNKSEDDTDPGDSGTQDDR
ncbi:MAG: SMC-Scp complex subunit ScpB [Pseudomonadales bacterium]|nr:SMC-Scp complex subunit ScpB [Pseudomonadales bacterium]